MRNAERKIAEIVNFVNRHYHGENEGQVIVLLDIVPSVVRFDCTRPDCVENLQISYREDEL